MYALKAIFHLLERNTEQMPVVDLLIAQAERIKS